MPNEILRAYDATPTDFTVTNIASLAAGNIWQSGAIDDTDDAHDGVSISYELVFNATPVAGDSLIFYWANGDEAASNEIWDGGIGTSEGTITSAANVAAVQAGCDVVDVHAWQTSHGTTFKGSFYVPNPGPSWQLLVEANGEALAASGNRIRYRYVTPEVQ